MKTTGLSVTHWFISLGLAALTLPLGWVMRQIPVPSKPSDFAAYFQEDFAVRTCALPAAAGLHGIRSHVCVSDTLAFSAPACLAQARMEQRRARSGVESLLAQRRKAQVRPRGGSYGCMSSCGGVRASPWR